MRSRGYFVAGMVYITAALVHLFTCVLVTPFQSSSGAYRGLAPALFSLILQGATAVSLLLFGVILTGALPSAAHRLLLNSKLFGLLVMLGCAAPAAALLTSYPLADAAYRFPGLEAGPGRGWAALGAFSLTLLLQLYVLLAFFRKSGRLAPGGE